MGPYLKALRIIWKFAPWVIVGILVLLLWNRPSTGGGGSAAGGAVVVAGKEALTPAAEKWKTVERECPPPPGSTQPAIKIVYRDVPLKEIERLAREYGTVVTTVATETTSETGSRTSLPAVSGPETPKPTLGLNAVFGEFYGPVAPYGTKFLSGLKPTGEFETRFHILPPPKFRFTWVYGGGVFADLSSSNGQTLDATRDNRVYLFLEPFQTKRVYWRLEGGMRETPQKWEQFWGVRAEWRTDPWVPKKWRGLQTIKAQ